MTERFGGASNPQGEHGEAILEDRVFRESSPTHSYGRMTYRYPFEGQRFSIELESAKIDSETMVLRATATNTSSDPGTLHVVLKGWLAQSRSVTAEPGGLILHGESSRVAIAGGESDDWLLTSDRSALDELLRGPGLHGGGNAHIGLLSYELRMAGGPVFRGSIAEVRGHLAFLLLERTSRYHCLIDSENHYDLEGLQREATEATEGVGPGPRLLEGRYFLGRSRCGDRRWSRAA